MSDTTTAPTRRPLTLNDLPLVGYRLACGHDGTDRAILKGDLIFCPNCTQLAKITAITP
ncbi:hypothetical protein [Tessaracoccus sp.]